LVRAALFRRAAARTAGEPRDAIVAAVAAELNATPEQIEAALFADLPDEQLLGELPSDLTPRELALRTNLAIAQGLVARSTHLVIELEGHARAVVRQAKLGGLICKASASTGPWRLDVSGPFALFRQTLLYGRALAALVPLLCWCPRFRLRAECLLRGERLRFTLSPDDPVFPADEPRPFDSLLEARLSRDLARLTPDWRLIREPGPLRAGARLAFPDFSLQHRSGGRRWLVEVVGFWTPAYLANKLALYRAAQTPDLILCIDDRRRCEPGAMPADARVVWFHRRIDPTQILAIVEGRHAST
jgi:predicted nuclease of restriction endonuclease-like RecB superfamily